MKKIHVHLEENIEWEQGKARPITLTLQTTDGRTLVRRANKSRGNAGWPLTEDEVHAKFRNCAGVTLEADKVEKSISILSELEKLPDIRELMSLISER
ncbi:MAG: hypothetical protein HN435_11345 [Nitrospinaceae bacterium]|nr:hypothetical protein [Nitrospinaceae bacterium]